MFTYLTNFKYTWTLKRCSGLSLTSLATLQRAIALYTKCESAKIYGSRAMGNYKSGSDIDIAILGERVDQRQILRLRSYLNEDTHLPYTFDIAHYDSISNNALKQHIRDAGRMLYARY